MPQDSSPKDADMEWWEKTWKEREDLLRSVFGKTEPPDSVIAFSWDRLDMVIPGACTLVFPPKAQDRDHWLYLSHGLTQPLEPSSTENDVSAYGWEFALLTSQASKWAPETLYELLSYWMESKTRMEVGHRMPMVFYPGRDEQITPMLRDLEPADPYPPLGQMRALLLWPYLLYPGQFSTSTGYFGIMVGTTITQVEWDLAKATSSTHLLLLLCEEGIVQLSDLDRQSVTNRATFQAKWQKIRGLSQDQAEGLLRKATGLQANQQKRSNA